MGFLSWVADHLKRLGRTPQAILDGLHRVSVVLWHVLTSLGGVVRKAWGLMLTGAKDIGYWSAHLADSIYTKMRELLTITLPHLATWLLAQAWKRASAAVNTVDKWAHTAVTAALHYAARIVADLDRWAHSAVKWLTDHVADALSRLGRVERVVFNLLDKPEHLVIWLFGALWRYAWTYLRKSEVAIARWLLGAAVGLALRSAREIESVIADII